MQTEAAHYFINGVRDRVETAPLDGRRPDPKRGLKSGPELGSSQNGGRDTSKTEGVDRSVGWGKSTK
jgi:hypothetical protein